MNEFESVYRSPNNYLILEIKVFESLNSSIFRYFKCQQFQIYETQIWNL